MEARLTWIGEARRWGRWLVVAVAACAHAGSTYLRVVHGNRLRSGFVGMGLMMAGLVAGASEPIRPPENLVAEGVPPIPATLAQELRRFTEARAASFAGWHPQRAEMLVATRFGTTTQLHQVAQPMGMRRQLTFFEEPVGSHGVDPVRGEFFIFGRDTGGSEFRQIYRQDVRDGRVTLLTEGRPRVQNGGVVWSRAGDRIAYTSTRRNGTDRDLYVMDPRDPATDRLVLEVSGGGWGVADWSPDDRRLIVYEYVSVNESHLWLLDLATGAKSELTPRAQRGVAYGGAAFDASGAGVYVTTDQDHEFKRLAHLRIADGAITFLTGDLPGDVDGFSLSRDGRRLVHRVNDRGVSRITLMDTATGAQHAVEGFPVGVISSGDWHLDHRHVAFTVGSATIAGDVFVLDAETGALVRWTESELGGLVAGDLAEAELVSWPSFDGREISGFLYRPAARFSGPRPVIIDIHGGPESQARPYFQGRAATFTQELGVAVIHPNVRGSTGQGKTFVALDNGRLREDAVRDIGALLDWIASRPEFDASRVMVMGGSYGGYMTLATAVHHGGRIRCAANVVGISNFVTFLESTESYRRDLRRAEYGDERDPEMRAFLEGISPLTHAARITSPLLVVQGANDPRVPRTEAVQMVETIRAQGGTVWYLEAKDEGHGFAKKPNRDFQFFTTVLFAKTYLLGE